MSIPEACGINWRDPSKELANNSKASIYSVLTICQTLC